MKQYFNPTLLLLITLCIGMYSCKERQEEEKPVFPSAELFTPWYVEQGDTVTISGTQLNNASIYLNGQETEPISGSGDMLEFVVPSDFTGGEVRVEYANGESHTFSDSLRVLTAQDSRTQVKEILLLGDFDGAGIRPANTGTDFNAGYWNLEAPVGAESGIGSNYNNTPSSNAGGNYFYHYVPDGSINPATSGWGGHFSSRNELMSDNLTGFPVSFADYPGSPVKYDGDVSEYYLNFYFKTDSLEANRDGENPVEIRVFLINPELLQEDQFSYTLSNGDNMASSNASVPLPFSEDWISVSIQLEDFRTGYGFDDNKPAISDLNTFNAVGFTFTDSRVNANGTKAGVSEEDEVRAGDGPIRVYLDHVSVSRGRVYQNPESIN